MSTSSNISLIINGCLNHNPAAERKLFDMYYGFVRSICNRYSYSLQDAEEMLNDTFYRTFKYLDKYDSEYDFKPWLAKIAVNCCLKHLQKSDFLKNSEDISVLEIANEPEVEIGTLEGSKYLEFIKKLPPQYRTVFNLYVFEDYKHSEIAELLQINIGTSKSNLSRAKNLLVAMINGTQHSKSLKSNNNG